jgi:hypothetical protein
MLARLAPIAILLLASCGGGQKGAVAPASGPAYGSGGGDPGAAYDYDTPAAESTPAQVGSSGTRTDVAQPPAERPGLGTTWGETTYSRVESRVFDRAGSAPFAAVALHYNDADGVAAHADYRGGAQPQPLAAYTPNRGISVALVDDRGAILPGLFAGGRTLIAGADGQRYRIQVVNHTGGRFEIVTSVDGLDVIDGRPADLAKRGYIIDPYQTLVIDGFRQSDDHVAAFRFGRVSSSYAARTSGDRNVGVIGLAFFAERGSPWTSDELHRRDTADPFPGDRSYARPPR